MRGQGIGFKILGPKSVAAILVALGGFILLQYYTAGLEAATTRRNLVGIVIPEYFWRHRSWPLTKKQLTDELGQYFAEPNAGLPFINRMHYRILQCTQEHLRVEFSFRALFVFKFVDDFPAERLSKWKPYEGLLRKGAEMRLSTGNSATCYYQVSTPPSMGITSQ